jgi:type II secretory ATPase GspE/PulE/Tfp pilus assembly ATPase PilB-like protein
MGSVENLLMRVSFLPCLHGESCTIRILSPLSDDDMRSLDDLIYNEKVLERVKDLSKRSQGLFIISGPTGSGKTTTYYSILNEREKEEEKIVSIEDPVEYSIEGISQIRINYKIGLTFPAALRSTLRNDPDVIAAGEIRNVETADILLQAALSGHMVFSSLHGSHAVSSLIRLINIGLEPSHIGDCLQGILAQQLVRILCDHCREIDSENYGTSYEGIRLYKACGCSNCHNGYKGRMAIHEFLPMTPALVKGIMARLDHNQLLEAARLDGFQSFWDNGRELLRDGLTSMAELKRVLPPR